MHRSEFVPPTVTYQGSSPGAEFILGVVPSLTPENFDSDIATEETERMEAEASRRVGMMQVQRLNYLYYQQSVRGE